MLTPYVPCRTNLLLFHYSRHAEYFVYCEEEGEEDEDDKEEEEEEEEE
ncbi:hypothetical protein PP707_04240 [Acetobacter pasteurianus]|nr:hypothetical protein [Acetobacter pasteurianus]